MRLAGPGGLTGGLALAAHPAAVRCARRHVRRVLLTWGWEVVADTAELLVSELVTNAIRACARAGARERAQGSAPCAPGVIELRVRRTETVVGLEIWDPSPAPPVPADAGLMWEDGRGLLLVESLSSDWGHRPAGSGGKVVWCEIRCPAAPGQPGAVEDTGERPR